MITPDKRRPRQSANLASSRPLLVPLAVQIRRSGRSIPGEVPSSSTGLRTISAAIQARTVATVPCPPSPSGSPAHGPGLASGSPISGRITAGRTKGMMRFSQRCSTANSASRLMATSLASWRSFRIAACIALISTQNASMRGHAASLAAARNFSGATSASCLATLVVRP